MNMLGTLYIVASPIGCLQDISARALDILRRVDLIACEDTRHSSILLHHYGIHTPLKAYHSHNESQSAEFLMEKLLKGESVALISDAGTPLIHDPGLFLVRRARQMQIKVVPIPGPCALITALSASGLPGAQFVFAGFLPVKSQERQTHLSHLKNESRTLIFYEAPHRILESLQDLITVMGETRFAVLGRELTKMYETILSGSLAELLAQLQNDPYQQKGEFVILLEGATKTNEDDADAKRVFEILRGELPLKQAASLTAKITGVAKNIAYQWGIDEK